MALNGDEDVNAEEQIDQENDPLARLQQLVQRAQQGDDSVLPELRAALDENPQVWRECGDLGRQAQAAWLHLLSGQDLLLRESVQRKVEEMRAELSGHSPMPLEMLLVERVLAGWLQCHYADALAAQARGPEATAGVRQELMKRQESSQKRYLSALKQLALVRKFKPALSPLEAMRPVNEGPASRRAGPSRAGVRLAGVE
jgi:hypothetical protein